MFRRKSLLILIVISGAIRILILFLELHNPHFSIIQDNYIGYIHDLQKRVLLTNKGNPNARLFPGYPLLILLLSSLFYIPYVISGWLISFFSSLFSLHLFNNIYKNRIALVLFSFFPPVWLVSSIKIATEPLTVLLLLTALTLFLQKKYFLAGLLLGYSTSVRLISICLLGAFLIKLFRNSKKEFSLLLLGFSLPIALFIIYNQIVLGNILYQFFLYPKVGGASGSSIGILQLMHDLPRAINWHQYRILFSGIFYIILGITSLFFLYKNRLKSTLLQLSFYWLLLSLIFILLYGPNPLLEEFSRFLIPFIPAVIIGISFPLAFCLRKINILSHEA